MAYRVNGILLSYDYQELIECLEEDIQDGIIKNEEIINIVRSEKPIDGAEYYPIIDYYKLNDLKTCSEPLQVYYNQEEYSDDEWEKMLEEQQALIAQYKKDEPRFEKTTVLAALIEMKQWDALLL